MDHLPEKMRAIWLQIGKIFVFSFSLIHRIRNVAFRPQWRIPSGDKSSRQAAVLGTAITRCG
jgi:hypothetical protein